LGRAERRAYNRKHKANLTREQYDSLIALARINSGNFDFSDLQVSPDFMHADNTELVPEGCACKLNYDAVMKRPKADKNPDFLQWVEEHKDVELHVTREGATNSLICFKEDIRYKEDPETGEQVRVEPWLFDTYTDILIKDDDGTYKTVLEIEEKTAKPVFSEDTVKEQNDEQTEQKEVKE
jgi:hypothetical protein